MEKAVMCLQKAERHHLIMNINTINHILMYGTYGDVA